MMSITPAQCRAARAWLQWSQIDLAAEAKISVPTINRFERGATSMSLLGQAAIVRVFEDAGVTFSRDEEMGYGGLTGRL